MTVIGAGQQGYRGRMRSVSRRSGCCRLLLPGRPGSGYGQCMAESGATRKPVRGRLRALRPQDRVVFNGRKVMITEAEAAVGYPVPLPDTVAASRANLDEVWVNSDTRQVGLVFAEKITIRMQPAIHPDPAHHFDRFVAENNVVAEVGQLRGQPALIITPNTDAYDSNPALVEFYRGDIDISVFSYDYGTATLLAVAESMP